MGEPEDVCKPILSAGITAERARLPFVDLPTQGIFTSAHKLLVVRVMCRSGHAESAKFSKLLKFFS